MQCAARRVSEIEEVENVLVESKKTHIDIFLFFLIQEKKMAR